ncbi:MAG: metallophosphoesterase [Alphaproteobacteria bacterium]|nr:metallophosphoesterase [Alphaproteobacteria bacterium]
MAFWIVYSVIAILCIILTALPLVGYCDCAEWIKIAVYVFLFVAWFSPIVIWNWQVKRNVSLKLYSVTAKIGYFLEGFAFLLMMILLIRDALWWFIYYFSNGWLIVSPLKDNIVADVNLITVAAVFFVSLYGVYVAERNPKILRYTFSDKRIRKHIKLLVASDLHITKMTPPDKVKSWVKYFNEIKADAVLFVGDVGDDTTDSIEKQIKELKKIKAPQGIFYVLGNHETYFNPYSWEAEFASLGWQVLHNSGVSIQNTGVYVAGLPDDRAFNVNVEQSVQNAENEYIILLSHIPNVIGKVKNAKVDLMLCGHTHGGQIFPFNWLTKLGNSGMVAGLYEREYTKVIISRGVGYWGPPMRIGAPSDVILLELEPEA